MNKKAIAAFAAGATLLAGFAMATPAFAEAPTTPKKITKSEANAQLTAAQNEYFTKVDAQREADANATKAAGDLEKAGAKPTDAAGKVTFEEDAKTKHLVVKCAAGSTVEAKAAADKYATAYNNDVDAKANAAEAKKAADDAYTKYLAAKEALKTADPDPVAEPTAEEATAQVYAASAARAAANKVVTEAKAKAVKAAADLAADQIAYNAAQSEKAAADAAVNTSLAKPGSDEYKTLTDRQARANAKFAFATKKLSESTAKFVEKKQAYLDAVEKYNATLEEYKGKVNLAATYGVDISKLPPVSTLDPLAPDFPAMGAADKVVEEAKAGKFGHEVQQAAAQKPAPAAAASKAAPAAGKAGAAAAKGELAAKGGNGHGKAGEKLGNAGVGVALTALAASMLAGMGAAVRKMRH